MIVNDGVLVFGELLAAQSAAERPIPEALWRDSKDISFSVRAINGTWDQTPMYSDHKPTEVCGTLFRHVENFNDPARCIIEMERMGAPAIADSIDFPNSLLAVGLRIITPSDWVSDEKIAAEIDSDYDDEGEESERLCYKYPYCIVSTPEGVENAYELDDVAGCGGMVVKFSKCESISARLWFNSRGELRALLVYTHDGPDFFSEFRLGDELIAPPLSLTDTDEQLRYAITLRNGEEIFLKLQLLDDENVFDRVLGLFPGRSLPPMFFVEAWRIFNPFDASNKKLVLCRQIALLESVDLGDIDVKCAIANHSYHIVLHTLFNPTALGLMAATSVLPQIIYRPFGDHEKTPVANFVLQEGMRYGNTKLIAKNLRILREYGYKLDMDRMREDEKEGKILRDDCKAAMAESGSMFPKFGSLGRKFGSASWN